MITLTRINGKRLVVNADLIRVIEENPDTLITLTTGDHVMVQESMRDVVAKSVEYGRSLRRLMPIE